MENICRQGTVLILILDNEIGIDNLINCCPRCEKVRPTTPTTKCRKSVENRINSRVGKKQNKKYAFFVLSVAYLVFGFCFFVPPGRQNPTNWALLMCVF